MLKPIQGTKSRIDPAKIMSFDIESRNWTEPVAIGWYKGMFNDFKYAHGSDCISEFVNAIMKQNRRGHHFYAHNGGRYDFTPIIEEVADRSGIEFEMLLRNNNPFYIKIYEVVNGEQKHPRHIHDSLALVPISLEQMTNAFSPQYAKGDFPYDEIDHKSNMSDEKWNELISYLENDCRGLYHSLVEFNSLIEELSEGKTSMQLTMGSTTMKVYRSCYQNQPLFPDGDPGGPEETAARESFFGGRTEVFDMALENTTGYHYDVNSLYPHSYSNFKMPVGPLGHTGTDFPIDDESYGGVVKIRGYVPRDTCHGVPVLPYRTRVSNSEKVIFPAGEISGWYNPSEVRYALDVGAIEDMEILDSYATEMERPFKDFGHSLYSKKQSIDGSENPGLYWVVKFLLNSFFGKFGMERKQSSIVRFDPETMTEQQLEGTKEINFNLASKGIFKEEQESTAKYIIPSIASEITARARIEMHKWFMEAFERGGNIWYCDTDSLVTDVKMPEGEGLGELDLEGVIDEGYYLAPKVYAELIRGGENVIKAKGMRELEASISDFAEAFTKENPSKIGTEWNAPRGFKAGMKDDKDSWFHTKNYSRSLKQFDVKRSHDESISGGTNSVPKLIGDLE